MINIALDMWPGGARDGGYSLGRITIANVGPTTPPDTTLCNYDVAVYSKTGALIRRGRVHAWPRARRSRMELVIAALQACGYK